MSRLRRLSLRAGAAGALVAGLFTVNAASANAIGDNCDGVEVPRCVYLVKDASGGIAVHASITDAGGGRNFDVAVNNIRLQRYTTSGWVTLSDTVGGDYDGWHTSSDVGSSRTLVCQGGSAYLRGAAYMQHRGAEANAYTIYTATVQISC